MNQLSVSFSIFDIFITLIWAVILGVFVVFFKKKFSNNLLNVYFFPAWSFKVLMAFSFSYIYNFIQAGGGDTIAYWEGANCLSELFYLNPSGYLKELNSFQSGFHISSNFNSETGVPPGWIYRELEAWNVSKLLSILSILTFKSYVAATFILASLAFFCSWMLAILLVKANIFGPKNLAFAMLFFPSVAFWSSGISKDTFVYVFSILSIYYIFSFFLNKKVNILKIIFFLIFILTCLFQLRPLIALSILIPFVLAFSTRLTNALKDRGVLKLAARALFWGIGIISLYFLLVSPYTQEMIKIAQVTQADFNNNPIYTGMKYELDNADLSILGLVSVFPNALFIGLFRPFLTESLNVNFIINGIESTLLLIYFAIFIFNRKLISNLSTFRRSEFAMFALFFVLILGFMAGYTSILFGVLVRIRAIALPFLFLVLSIRNRNIQTAS